MPESAVADTGPLLHLAEIRAEDLLTAFERLLIPIQVAAELAQYGVAPRLEAALGERLRHEQVTAEEIAEAQSTPVPGLSEADWSVVALAARNLAAVTLTDDLTLRRALEARGHTVVGSLGIVIRAHTDGRLDGPGLERLLDQLCQGSTLYLSPALRSWVRRLIDDAEGPATAAG